MAILMLGRVNSSKGNTHGAMPTAGMAKTILLAMPTAGMAKTILLAMPTAGVVNRVSGSTSSGNIIREMPVDGRDIAHSGKAAGISGSTREGRPTAGRIVGMGGSTKEGRPTAGMVNGPGGRIGGMGGRIGGIMPTGGMVSSSKASSLPRVNLIIPDILMPA
jgi:hypothetical protein